MPPKTETHTEDEKIKELLLTYTELKPRQFKNIKVKDYVRYVIDGQLRQGGMVVKVDIGYVVLKSLGRNISWSVDLTQPNLRMFLKNKLPK